MRAFTLSAADLARVDEVLRAALTDVPGLLREEIEACARVIDVITEELEDGDTITITD